MITVTFIRHGESEDNTKSFWAGWKDAPLSDLGQRQAYALAKSMEDVKLDYIYTSPLLRAYATGKAVQDAQHHQPPFIVNPKLREQHFGVAEGKPWVWNIPKGETLESMIGKGVYPVLLDREDKFPEGESLEDLARRAEEAINECVLPHVCEDGVHVAIASHGLCISELITALMRLDPKADSNESYTGLLNTGWTRLRISPRDSDSSAVEVQVTDVNRIEHLAHLPLYSDPFGLLRVPYSR